MEEFAEFYLSSKDRVFRTVAVVTRDGHAAEDAVAEAYARALARWRRLREHPNPAAWVLRTALNAHTSWWRRHRREFLGDPPERPADPEPDGGLSTDLRRQVLDLPARQREVLALRLLADLSAAETGELLGISAATVHVHLHRALGTLRSVRESTSSTKETRG